MTDRPNAAHTLESFVALHQEHGTLERKPLLLKLPPGSPKYIEVTCTPCGKTFTTLESFAQEVPKMARGPKVPVQEQLVQLTDEEKAALPQKVAAAWKEYEEMERAHKKVANENAKARKQVKAKISAYCSQIELGAR